MRQLNRALAPLILLIAVLLPSGTATAAPAESTRTQEIFGEGNLCNGLEVILEGTLHIVSKAEPGETTIFHLTIHGQGTNSNGDQYVFNETFHFRSTPDRVKSDDYFRLISKGSIAPDEIIRFRFDTKTGVDTFEIECRG